MLVISNLSNNAKALRSRRNEQGSKGHHVEMKEMEKTIRKVELLLQK
jgi:hypothetical protein